MLNAEKLVKVRTADTDPWWRISAVLFCFVIVFKLAKIGRPYLSWYEPWKVLGVAVATAAVVSVVFWVMWAAIRGMRGLTRPMILGLAALAGVAAGELLLLLVAGSAKWMTWRLLGVLAQDLGFVAVSLAVPYLVARFAPRASLFALTVVSSLLLLLYSVETVFFLRTGTTGSWLLVEYFLRGYDVRGAVMEDLDIRRLSLVLVPQVILLLACLASTRSRAAPGLRPALRLAGSGVALLVVGASYPVSTLPPSYQVHSRSLGVSLLRDAATRPPPPDHSTVDFRLPAYDSSTTIVRRPNTPPKNIVVVVLESVRSQSAPPQNREGVWMPFLDSLSRASAVVERLYTTVPYTSEALLSIFGGVVPPFNWLGPYDTVAEIGWAGLLRDAGYETAFFTAAYLNEKRAERSMLEKLGFSTVVGAADIGDDAAALETYTGVDDLSLHDPVFAWVDETARDSSAFVLACLTQSSHHPYRLPPTVPRVQAGIADAELERYLNTLTYVDGFLRALVAGFGERGLLESTAFVFIGDHGESFGEHDARFHGMNVWEEGIRVPLIIYGSSIRSSGVTEGPFQQTDLFSSMIETAGFDLEGAPRRGRSIWSDGPRERIRVASAGSQAMALVAGHIKYVYHYRRRPMQVFDLGSDPRETTDLASATAAGELQAVERELLLWEAAANDRTSR